MLIAKANKQTSYLPALTSMRFLAALHVMAYHYFPMSALYGSVRATQAYPVLNLAVRGLLFFIGAGHVEVALFFILSGFILTYTYLDESSPRRHGGRDFVVARVARILPVYLAAWIFMGIYVVGKAAIGKGEPITNGQLFANAIASLFFVQSWWPTTLTAWNVPAWSVADEAFFYAVFVFMFLAPTKALIRTSGRAVGIIFLAAFSFKCLATIAYYAFRLDGWSFHELVATFQSDRRPMLFWETFLVHCPVFRISEFLLGILLAQAFMAGRSATTTASTPSTIARMPAALVLAIYSVAAIASEMFLPQLAQSVILIPFQALVVFRLAYPVSAWTGLLSAPMLLLGEASYALYLFHGPVAMWVHALQRVDGPQGVGAVVRTGQPIVHLLCAFATIVGSIIIYKSIEVPGRRAIRDRLGKYLLASRPPREAPLFLAQATTAPE